ncbi:MAG TPA: ATP-binding protein [Vicinamibacterales bacterium]|jgi:PAS domain S-box-containing protein|nr:ATP-binding protein [Vicinamibacterales bacterium]
MPHDAGDDGRLSKMGRFLFGRDEADDDGQTYPNGHYCFYRALAEGALDIITVVDEFGTIVYKSPSTEQHLGYRPDELIGRNLFEFVHSDDIPRVRAAFDDSRRNDSASAPIEHRLRHMDGLWRTFESVGRFQSDGAGGRIGIIHSRDVSARKLLEAQVRQAQKMEAVGLSTGAIAHDFNNMLVVIAGYTALLATDQSQTVREFAREMRMATDRATELTSQLLSFARASQTDEPVCDANDVIADFRPILDRMVGRDVHVSYAHEASPASVPVGRSALDQVLINLVVNARDAMPAGGELTVTTSNEWRPRQSDLTGAFPLAEFVVLRITDTGVGMNDDVKARIFEPFFTTKAPGRGTGIGLQTVHGIVTQAGGRIDVISAPGSGTTFRVLLPLHPAAAVRE